MASQNITSACNRTVKPVTRFAKKPAKPAPALPAVEAGVMAQVKVCCRLIPYVSGCPGPVVAIEWADLQNKLRMKNFTNRGL